MSRNPLLNAMNRVQQTIPRPIAPTSEQYDQDRFRDGSDVDPADDMGPTGAEGYNDTSVPVHTEPKPVLRDPVPVVLVVDETRSREFLDWRTSNESVDNVQSRRIINRQRSRTKVIIRNLGPSRLWISKNPNVAAANGFPIDINTERELTSTEEVYAIGDTGRCEIAILTHLSINVGEQ